MFAHARLLAVISRHSEALQWTRQKAEQAWGPVALESPSFLFDETDYYTASMGPALRKTFLVFARSNDPAHGDDPGQLADWKHTTGRWEAEYAALGQHAEQRPLNLDPGYLTLAKLVLASTKDHAHRIYLGQQMFAEVTLHYKHGRWQPWEWTFPDYRRADYAEFFVQVRERLRRSPAAG